MSKTIRHKVLKKVGLIKEKESPAAPPAAEAKAKAAPQKARRN